MSRPTAVIADDHGKIRQGIRGILGAAGIEVVAEAGDGLQAIALVLRDRPARMTLDIAMPFARSIEFLTEVRR